jgi:hypothetical protein
MTDDDRDPHDAALDRALSGLPEPEVDPLWSRATRLAAERRSSAAQPVARGLRYEPFLLIALSAAQLIWAALRVLALAH